MSIHKKLSRVRKPRVHISYEVETGGAAVEVELPFVVGVMGDFSGNPTAPLKPLKDRKFVQIDRDNFDEVMGKIGPELHFKVENTLQGDGSEMAVDLKFKSIEDFEPGRIAQQVEPLKKLLETRHKLNDLMAKVDRSEELEGILENVLQNSEDLNRISKELGGGAPAGGEPAAADDSAGGGDGGGGGGGDGGGGGEGATEEPTQGGE